MARAVDDFSWLAAGVQRAGGDPAVRPATRITERGGDLTMSGLKWGEGAVDVVYLHGGAQNAHTWDMTAALAGASALAIDLPGHGHSSWRDDQHYSGETCAEAVAGYLDATGTRPRLVVGMSLGGLTALALAADRPELVPSLILVDVLPGIEVTSATLDHTKLGSVSLISGPRVFDSLESMEEATLAAVGPGRSPETVKRGVWHNAKQNPDGTWGWRYDDLRVHGRPETVELWGVVERSTQPLMLVRGGDSPLVSDDSVAMLRALRPDARVEVVPGAGHSVQSAAPGFLAGVIAEALRRDQ